MLALSDGDRVLCEQDRDELPEILLRLLKSFLNDSGPKRSEKQLRRFLSRWLIPVIEERLQFTPGGGTPSGSQKPGSRSSCRIFVATERALGKDVACSFCSGLPS